MLVKEISNILGQFVSLSDCRFAIGVRIRYNNPTLIFQTYPDRWLQYYDSEALLLQDPTVMWGMTHTGLIDWEDLTEKDSAGVLEKAKSFGLRFGIAVSVGAPSQRTLGFVSNATSAFSDEQKKWVLKQINAIHDLTEGLLDAPGSDLAMLRNINNDLAKYRS